MNETQSTTLRENSNRLVTRQTVIERDFWALKENANMKHVHG